MSLCVQGRLPSSLDALKLRESCWLHLIVNDSFLTMIRSCNWAPKSLKIVAWKLLLNYVHFTIFVSRPRVQPQTPLDAIIATKREVDHIRGSSSPQRNTTINLCQELNPIVGAHPPLQPHCCSIYFLLWWVLLQYFSFPMFCRSLFMMHLTQQSTILQLGIEQIWALTTMFTVEDSSDNDFGDSHNG